MIDQKNKVEEKRQRRGKHLHQQYERERTLQKRIGQQEVVLLVSNETQHRDDDQLVSSCWDNGCCMRPLRHRGFAEEEKRLCKESGFCQVLDDHREESLVEQIEHYQDLHEWKEQSTIKDRMMQGCSTVVAELRTCRAITDLSICKQRPKSRNPRVMRQLRNLQKRMVRWNIPRLILKSQQRLRRFRRPRRLRCPRRDPPTRVLRRRRPAMVGRSTTHGRPRSRTLVKFGAVT